MNIKNYKICQKFMFGLVNDKLTLFIGSNLYAFYNPGEKNK